LFSGSLLIFCAMAKQNQDPKKNKKPQKNVWKNDKTQLSATTPPLGVCNLVFFVFCFFGFLVSCFFGFLFSGSLLFFSAMATSSTPFCNLGYIQL
jgi:hypothetical protein